MIKGMHRVGGWDHKGVIVSPYASTHQVLIQHHGVLGFVHPRVSNINYTTSTPKGVTVVIKGMHRVGGWDHKGVIVSPYASTHQVLI